MHKSRGFVLFCVMLLCVMQSCNDAVSRSGNGAAPGTDASAIAKVAAGGDYEGAMSLAEDAMFSGQLSAFDSYVLRAKMTYQHTEDYDQAAGLMRKALEQEEASDPSARLDLLYHLATILKSARDYTSCLAVCAEGRELSHTLGNMFEEYSFDHLAGNALYAIGEEESGLGMMKDAISYASSIASSEAQHGHVVFFTHNLVNCLEDFREYGQALEWCDVNEAQIVKMARMFPSLPADYLDRCWFYLEMSRATCNARIGKGEIAASCFNAALQRDYASTRSGLFRTADYYAAAGAPADVVRIYDEIPFEGSDTVSRCYRFRISRLHEAYANAGMTAEADAMALRYEALSSLLEQRENAEGVRVRAVEYDAQQYRHALGDTLSKLREYRLIIVLMVAFLVLALAVFVILNHRIGRRAEEQYQRETSALQKDLRSLQRQVSLIAQKEFYKDSPGGPEQQEASLTELIEGRELYLNKNINRDGAASMLGVSQSEISRLLSEIEPGLSFPDYIRGLRIRHALKLLGENPDMPISELAEKSGFYTTRTLQRSFLAITGKTPSEYAKQLKIR